MSTLRTSGAWANQPFSTARARVITSGTALPRLPGLCSYGSPICATSYRINRNKKRLRSAQSHEAVSKSNHPATVDTTTTTQGSTPEPNLPAQESSVQKVTRSVQETHSDTGNVEQPTTSDSVRDTPSTRQLPLSRKASFPMALVAAVVSAPFYKQTQSIMPDAHDAASQGVQTAVASAELVSASEASKIVSSTAVDEFVSSKAPATLPPSVTAAAVAAVAGAVTSPPTPSTDTVSPEQHSKGSCQDAAANSAANDTAAAAAANISPQHVSLLDEFITNQHPASAPPAVTAAAAAELVTARSSTPPLVLTNPSIAAPAEVPGSANLADEGNSSSISSSQHPSSSTPSATQQFNSSKDPTAVPPAVTAAAAAACQQHQQCPPQPSLDSWSVDGSETDETAEQQATQLVMELLAQPQHVEQQMIEQQQQQQQQQGAAAGQQPGVGVLPEYVDALVHAVRDSAVGVPHGVFTDGSTAATSMDSHSHSNNNDSTLNALESITTSSSDANTSTKPADYGRSDEVLDYHQVDRTAVKPNTISNINRRGMRPSRNSTRSTILYADVSAPSLQEQQQQSPQQRRRQQHPGPNIFYERLWEQQQQQQQQQQNKVEHRDALRQQQEQQRRDAKQQQQWQQEHPGPNYYYVKPAEASGPTEAAGAALSKEIAEWSAASAIDVVATRSRKAAATMSEDGAKATSSWWRWRINGGKQQRNKGQVVEDDEF